MLRVALDHREIVVLAAMVEAEPQAEAVGQRHFLLDRLARIDGARALVLHHLARHQVAAVRGGVEEHVGGAALDAALERRLQRLVGRVAGVERKVVAEDDEPKGASRISLISAGRPSMSSRWISTSFRRPATPSRG